MLTVWRRACVRRALRCRNVVALFVHNEGKPGTNPKFRNPYGSFPKSGALKGTPNRRSPVRRIPRTRTRNLLKQPYKPQVNSTNTCDTLKGHGSLVRILTGPLCPDGTGPDWWSLVQVMVYIRGNHHICILNFPPRRHNYTYQTMIKLLTHVNSIRKNSTAAKFPLILMDSCYPSDLWYLT